LPAAPGSADNSANAENSSPTSTLNAGFSETYERSLHCKLSFPDLDE
jgi:hypothetical protein